MNEWMDEFVCLFVMIVMIKKDEIDKEAKGKALDT